MECAGQRAPERRTAPPPRPPPPGCSSAQRGGSTQDATSGFRTFQNLHDKAYATVQKGLKADEEGDTAAAERHYASSLELLDNALSTDCENLPEATADEKDTAKQMLQKMQKTSLQISYRLESIRSTGPVSVSPLPSLDTEEGGSGVRLPSYDEAVSSSHSSLVSDAALGDSIMAAEYPGMATGQRISTEGTELFSLSDGVQIFHITRDGFVSAPSYPTSLHIVKLQESTEGTADYCQSSNAPPAFLQVGEWFYPLIPGASPVLHTSYGAYLFPDLSPEGAGSSVGLMLPDTVSAEERRLLEDILRSCSAVQEQQAYIQPEDLVVPSAPLEEPEEATAPITVTRTGDETQERQGVQDQSTSSKISQGILVASKWISWGVGKGAEKAGELVSYGSTKLRDKLQPEEQPKPVDPRVQKGMVYARKATHVAVSVSAFVVSKLGEATMALGRQVAPHIRKKGEELMPKSMKSDKSKSKLDGVIEVAASGLQGFGTVYMSLEGAAKALARSLANETVATVQHKYGEQAGKLTEDTVYAAGNVALAAYNVDNLGIKALAKRAAKDTGKAVLEDIREKKNAGKQVNGHTNGACYDGSGGSGYGNDKKGKPPM